MWKVRGGILRAITVITAITIFLVYRQYMSLAYESMEYAALMISSIKEAEDGSVTIDLLNLAALSMDHTSQLSGLLKWIRL